MPTIPVFHFLSYNTFTLSSGDFSASLLFALLYNSSQSFCLFTLKSFNCSANIPTSFSSSDKNAARATFALPIRPAAFTLGATEYESDVAVISFTFAILRSDFIAAIQLPCLIRFNPSFTRTRFSSISGILSAIVANATTSRNSSALSPISALERL